MSDKYSLEKRARATVEANGRLVKLLKDNNIPLDTAILMIEEGYRSVAKEAMVEGAHRMQEAAANVPAWKQRSPMETANAIRALNTKDVVLRDKISSRPPPEV